MRFATSYQGAIFFIGIAMIFFEVSESKIDESLDQDNEAYPTLDGLSSLSYNSIFAPIVKGKTPTPTEPTSTKKKTIPVSLNNATPLFNSNPSEKNHHLESVISKNKQKECKQLNKEGYLRELIPILSPEIFLQIDPFRYLVDKVMKNVGKNTAIWIRQELNNYLEDDQLPHCYVPYAKALSSLLLCWPHMDAATCDILGIKRIRPNDIDSSFMPPNVSWSPELLQLFSGEIFGDPNPPTRIFYKLLNIPKNDIVNLQAQLQKFVKLMKSTRKFSGLHLYYIRYAEDVWKFLQNESALDDLKREMTAIQSLATSDQRFLPAESTV